MIGEATEMYLITIYRLTDDALYTHINDVAAMLKLHHSSVSEKVKRLVEQGYVNYDVQRGVNLTEAGRAIAINVLRKHRLIKTFLVQMANYSIDEVYDEACQLEHAITDRLANSLESILNYPQFDPHGYPIPTREGQVKKVDYKSLNDFVPGNTVVVRRIDALNQAKLSYLRELGLIPGTRVTIQSIAPFDGPLMLKIDDVVIAIAPSLAQEIEVSAD